MLKEICARNRKGNVGYSKIPFKIRFVDLMITCEVVNRMCECEYRSQQVTKYCYRWACYDLKGGGITEISALVSIRKHILETGS